MIETILLENGINCDFDRVHVDWSPAKLIEHSVSHHEAYLTSTGSLSVSTGAFTGRSPENRYIVDAGEADEQVNWNSKTNKPIDEATYKRVRKNVVRYMSQRRHLFVIRGYAGADRQYARKVMVVCERAHQALFIQNMLVRPSKDELEVFGRPDIMVLAAPTYVCSRDRDGVEPAAVMLDMNGKQIIVAGTGYCGEIKKAVFTMMNYLLPIEDGVLPMHCSANVDPDTGKTCILFGLSGTGKTTLSADPARLLIGDDEHGWSPRGVSRAAATPRPSTSRASASQISSMPFASAACPRTSSSTVRAARPSTPIAPLPRTVAPPTRSRTSSAWWSPGRARCRASCSSSRPMPTACCRPSRA